MAHYELTQAADDDFDQLFDYGIDNFGLERAMEYQEDMQIRFGKIAEQPKLYSIVDNVDGGYRRAVFRAHSIYYRVESTHIVIVRILGRQDLTKAFTWLT